MHEVVTAYVSEEFDMPRRKAATIVTVACSLVGIVCSLSFGPLSEFHLFGRAIFDFFDNLSSNVLMTLGSLLTVLFVGWRLKKTDIYVEFTNGGTLRPNVRIFGVLWILIRYVAPVAVLAVFISGLIG